MSAKEARVDLDYVLVNELGQFGRIQVYNILLMSIPLMMTASFGEFVFTTADLPHRCRIPPCDNFQSTEFAPSWITDAIPKEGSKLSSCFRFRYTLNPNTSVDELQDNQKQCSALLFNKSAIEACDEYVYKSNNTVVYDFDLGCSEWLRTLPGTLNGVGCLLALPITGYFSDRFGRRLVLIINILNVGIFGVLRAFSVNYTMFTVLQLLQTTLGSGIYSTAYIIATELTGPQYRKATGTIASVIFGTGGIVVGCLAYLVRPWRYLILVLFAPCFIAIPLHHCFLMESVRWLLSKQKFHEAKIILEKIAKVNGKEIKPETMLALMKPAPEKDNNDQSQPLVSAIFGSSILLRRVCTTPVWWVATSLNFYGLTITSISLSDNMYLDYALVALVEIPGLCFGWLIVDRIGRKPVMAGGFMVCAICDLLQILVPVEMSTLRLGLSLIAKFSISMVFNCLYLYTSELYPTEYRHTLLGFSSMIGRIGNILSPITPALSQYWAGTPLTLFGVTSLIAGLLALTQPETLGTQLPDTLRQAELLGRTRSSTD